MRLKKHTPLDRLTETTAWVGDEDCDVAASDVSAWARTGDATHLVARRGRKLAAIRYRPLSELELVALGEVPFPDGSEASSSALALTLIIAAGYGLLSIEGENLRRDRLADPPRLARGCLEDLLGIDATFDLGPALTDLFEAVWGALPTPPPAPAPDPDDAAEPSDPPPSPERPSLVSLPIWLGVQILGRTFRQRRARDAR